VKVPDRHRSQVKRKGRRTYLKNSMPRVTVAKTRFTLLIGCVCMILASSTAERRCRRQVGIARIYDLASVCWCEERERGREGEGERRREGARGERQGLIHIVR